MTLTLAKHLSLTNPHHHPCTRLFLRVLPLITHDISSINTLLKVINEDEGENDYYFLDKVIEKILDNDNNDLSCLKKALRINRELLSV